MSQPTRGNATKTHSLRLESQLIDRNRVKVRHSFFILLTLHQLLLHSLNFLGEELHFFSLYYVNNSAHVWLLFSLDVTFISIANRQSNNASQQLDRVQTLVISHQFLRDMLSTELFSIISSLQLENANDIIDMMWNV